MSYPGRDVLGTLTAARQPLLHGPGHYDRAAARAAALRGGMPGGRAGGVPGPPWDAQDVADAKTVEERIAASGVTGDSDAERRAAYAAYLVMLGSGTVQLAVKVATVRRPMLGSGTVQLAVKVAHEYLNKHSLVVSAGPGAPRFRLNGDHTLLASPAGALSSAQAAAASRQAIAELLRDGETAVDSWDIFNSFPDHVEQGGRMISAAPVAPDRAAGAVLRTVRPAFHAGGARPDVDRLPAARHAGRQRPVTGGGSDPDQEQPGVDHAARQARHGRRYQPVQATAGGDRKVMPATAKKTGRDRVR